MAKHNDIICLCYVNLTDSVEKYQDNWICNETWFRVISARYPNVINSVGFSRAAFNRAILGHASLCGSLNESLIFKQQFSMPCPYDSNQRRRVSFYYRQVAGKPPAAPLDSRDCEAVHVRVRPVRLLTAEREESLPLLKLLQSTAHCDNRNNDSDGGDNVMHPKFTIYQNNDEGGDIPADVAEVTPHKTRSSVGAGNKVTGLVQQKSKPIYWDSAAILFGFDEGEDVYAGLRQRVTLLKGAIQKPDGVTRQSFSTEMRCCMATRYFRSGTNVCF
jgi:hypothetical protein